MLVEFCSQSMDRGKQVDVLYFDYRRAFDRISCKILLSKLDALGFSTKLIRLFTDYFRDRQQFVRHGSFVSQPYSSPSGVTQGSILGPLLFLLMVNDVVQVLKYTNCLLYADDLKLYAEVNDEADCVKMQNDVDALIKWSDENGLKFNRSKCHVMTFSRKQNLQIYNYRLGNDIIIRTLSLDCMKDLGVTFGPFLMFNAHISALTRNCFSRLGFVLRHSREFMNPEVIKSLFISLVRSTLETSACVWNPHEAKNRLMLEKVQKAFLRCYYKRLHGYYPFMYPTMFLLGMLEMNSLEVRRARIDLSTAMSVLRGGMDSPECLDQLSRLFVPDKYYVFEPIVGIGYLRPRRAAR
jgi:ribonucleases P/MRP protein subunit RPP40